ncbi:phage holin [Bacillaceae bacterium SAOS 7]|nr:phage holin [Bacillaceae bacterium SAOS 7]
MNKLEIGTIVRTVVLFVALLNQSLVMMGYSPLPFSDEQVEKFFSMLMTVIAAIWAWWKNNTKRNDEILRRERLK